MNPRRSAQRIDFQARIIGQDISWQGDRGLLAGARQTGKVLRKFNGFLSRVAGESRGVLDNLGRAGKIVQGQIVIVLSQYNPDLLHFVGVARCD